MSRTHRLSLVLLSTTAAALVSACHVSGCREGDQECSALTSSSSSSSSSSGSSSTGSTATTEDQTSSSGLSSSGTTMVIMPVCGNGLVEDGEQCDDGNGDDADACSNQCEAAFCGDGVVQLDTEECDDGDRDNTDPCVAGCKFASCGDGFVFQGAEACDNGPANDDTAYEGCTKSCVFGPRCGDAKVNGPEECDDKNLNETDGCLSMCVEPYSCLHIKQLIPTATTGLYRIWPESLGGEASTLVWCDMDTDGGGYSYLKVDVQVANQSDKGAASAEAFCQSHGMHLLITRTPAHTKASYTVAMTNNILPIGGGGVKSGVDYLAMLAIYPTMMGAICDGKGLNSVDCPGWQAGDQKPYWVTDIPVPGQPDIDHCLGCSMLYKWNPDGTVKSYTTIGFGEGASSYRFLCDVGDKHP